MFTIYNGFFSLENLDESLRQVATPNPGFDRSAGVLCRKIYNVLGFPNLVWSVTEWTHEEAHNNGAQKILKTRRDDRFAAAGTGGSPYFEAFCEQCTESAIGSEEEALPFTILVHGVWNKNADQNALTARVQALKSNIPWFRYYWNTSNPDEFFALLSFHSEEEYASLRMCGEFTLEERIFANCESPFAMGEMASYNQFRLQQLYGQRS
jgi:hypothetical protein